MTDIFCPSPFNDEDESGKEEVQTDNISIFVLGDLVKIKNQKQFLLPSTKKLSSLFPKLIS